MLYKRTLGVISKIEGTLSAMQLNMGAMAAQLEQHAETQARMSEDISGLYGQLGQSRPSRQRPPKAGP